MIQSIHLGLSGGATTTNGHFGIDNLTIGASSVPEPATLLLVGSVLIAWRLRGQRRV